MLNSFSINFYKYFNCIDNFRYNSETYTEYVAFCLKSGSFSYKIDNEKEQVLSAGEIVICPPQKSFQRKIINSIDLCMIKFSTSENVDFCGKSIPVCDISRFNFDLNNLKIGLYCLDMNKQPRLSHYCTDIIYIVADSYVENSVLSEIHKDIIENFNSDINIDLLAKKSGYSSVHFINIFKKIYGCTPKKYLLNIRMQKAKELLVNTNKSSKEIAYLCGFHDELYFIRYFKRNNNVTPTEYRRMKILKL